MQFFAFTSYWKKSPAQYKKLVIGLILFALFNSSDVFLLLKMKESGLTDTSIIAVYIFYNLVFALLAYPIGILADKLGFKKTLIYLPINQFIQSIYQSCAATAAFEDVFQSKVIFVL